MLTNTQIIKQSGADTCLYGRSACPLERSPRSLKAFAQMVILHMRKQDGCKNQQLQNKLWQKTRHWSLFINIYTTDSGKEEKTKTFSFHASKYKSRHLKCWCLLQNIFILTDILKCIGNVPCILKRNRFYTVCLFIAEFNGAYRLSGAII